MSWFVEALKKYALFSSVHWVDRLASVHRAGEHAGQQQVWSQSKVSQPIERARVIHTACGKLVCENPVCHKLSFRESYLAAAQFPKRTHTQNPVSENEPSRHLGE